VRSAAPRARGVIGPKPVWRRPSRDRPLPYRWLCTGVAVLADIRTGTTTTIRYRAMRILLLCVLMAGRLAWPVRPQLAPIRLITSMTTAANLVAAVGRVALVDLVVR